MPSYAAGQQFLESAAKNDIKILNTKIDTISGIAHELIDDYLYKNNIKFIDRTSSYLLIKNIVTSLYQKQKLNYFSKLELTNGLIKAIDNAIFNLRMADKKEREISADDFIRKDKGEDIKKNLKEYENILDKRNYIDKAGLLKLLLNKYDPIKDSKIYIIPKDMKLKYLEEKIIDKLPAEQIYNLDFALKSDLDGLQKDKIEIQSALGESNEIKGLIRKIKKENIPFDKVNIIYTTSEPYSQLLYQQSQRLNLDVTFQNGISIKNTKPAQLLNYILDYINDIYNHLQLKSIFENGIVKIDKRKNNPLAEILDKLAVIKENEEINPAVFSNKVIEIIDNHSKIITELDAEAKKEIIDLLEKTGEYSSDNISVNDYIISLKDILDGLRVGASSSKTGHIHFTSYKNAVWNKREYNFIIGLDESKFPGQIVEDPILLDSERESLNNLELSKNRNKENIKLMTQLLENIDSRIYLYYTNFDNIDNRELAPSSYLLQVYRSLENDDSIDYGDFKDKITEINTFIPEDNNEILSEKEKWLFYDSKSKIENMDDIFLNQYSNIFRGEKALAKMKEGFNKFNGNVNVNPADVDPRLNERIFSVSRLESIAKCPYGYFLNYILGIEPPEDKEFDNENWLDPLQRGSLLHSIYEKFYKEITENGEERVKYSKHKKLMDSFVDREVEQLKKEVIPPSELVYESEVEEIKNSTDLFLKMEEENDENLKPVYFEFKFGFNYGENNSEEVKLTLPSGDSIKLRGKIDRIDKIGKDLYNIIDYKTGSTYSYNNNDYFNQGTQLQHAVYALAFEKLMDNEVEVSKSIYYFPTLKGEGIKIVRLKDGLNKREDVKELIDNLLDIIAKGNFSMSKCDYNTNPCKYCDYNQICNREKYDEINDFIQDENIEELDIVRRLEQYD